MSCPIEGIIHVTGEPDTGKTTFAYTSGSHPSKIAFFDNDIKSKSLHRQLNFGIYLNLVKMFTDGGKLKPVEFHNMVLRELDKIEPGSIETLIFDNWTQMEDGIAAYAEEHMVEMSNLTRNQIQNMNMLTWPYKRLYYVTVLDRLLEVAPTVFIITHVKDQWLNKRKTGAKVPRCQEPLVEKSSFRIWLRHNPDSQAPIGLVLKRIAKSEWSDEKGRIVPLSVLPRKIAPCDWDKINEYLEHPVGNRPLTADEMPDEDEIAILEGTLTDDQKLMLRAAVTEDLEEEEELDEVPVNVESDKVAEIKKMKEEGKSNREIARDLGLTILEVKAAL